MPTAFTQQSRELTAQDARVVMRQRLADPTLGVEDVARAVAVSRRQLQRVFETAGSPGFAAELAEMRIERAAELLLADPLLSISDVTLQVGLRHRSNFARLFRAHYGLNPVQWRQSRRRTSRSI